MTEEIALEDRGEDGDRLFSPSAARNRDVVRDAFQSVAPASGLVLEIGSGTGEHVTHFADAMPSLTFAPGDPDQASRRSIAAWTRACDLKNVRAPHSIDVRASIWEVEGEDVAPASLSAVISLNMIHISPFDSARGLLVGAGARLSKGGVLFLYGPFARDGAHTAPSNADFDQSLKSRNPDWGVRDLDLEINPIADAAGLQLREARPMPANNFSVIFEKNG